MQKQPLEVFHNKRCSQNTFTEKLRTTAFNYALFLIGAIWKILYKRDVLKIGLQHPGGEHTRACTHTRTHTHTHTQIFKSNKIFKMSIINAFAGVILFASNLALRYLKFLNFQSPVEHYIQSKFPKNNNFARKNLFVTSTPQWAK